MMQTTLHVTNGDSAIERLRAAGIDGQFIAWRDVLHDGPVPAMESAELRAVRARFIASRGWGTAETVLAEFDERDRTLSLALARGDEVSLWFEHDLYDQLQLVQVLVMAAPAIRSGATVLLAQADDYLGTMEPAAVHALATRRVRVGERELAEAEAAWIAFTGSSAESLARVAHGRADADAVRTDVDALRYLRPALQRLLEEFPNPVTGLSRTELQTLRAIGTSPRTPRQAYTAAHHDAESPIWLGDASFFAMVDDLCEGSRPLLSRNGDLVQITADGTSVLSGQLHRAAIQPVDRWIGGVHLTG